MRVNATRQCGGGVLNPQPPHYQATPTFSVVFQRILQITVLLDGTTAVGDGGGLVCNSEVVVQGDDAR